MREAIEGGSGEPLAAEHLGPLLEGKVRGHDQTLPLIGRAQDVKKQLGPYLPGRNVAQFVKNDEFELLDLLTEPEELLLLLGLHEQRDQFGHPKESHLSSLPTGREALFDRRSHTHNPITFVRSESQSLGPGSALHQPSVTDLTHSVPTHFLNPGPRR